MQPPAILKPVELWTGKQVFSLLLRPHCGCRVFVNLHIQEKSYTSNEHLCPRDGYVAIVNSELVSGRVGKGLLGGGKGALFAVLDARYSSAVAGALPHFATAVHSACCVHAITHDLVDSAACLPEHARIFRSATCCGRRIGDAQHATSHMTSPRSSTTSSSALSNVRSTVCHRPGFEARKAWCHGMQASA